MGCVAARRTCGSRRYGIPVRRGVAPGLSNCGKRDDRPGRGQAAGAAPTPRPWVATSPPQPVSDRRRRGDIPGTGSTYPHRAAPGTMAPTAQVLPLRSVRAGCEDGFGPGSFGGRRPASRQGRAGTARIFWLPAGCVTVCLISASRLSLAANLRQQQLTVPLRFPAPCRNGNYTSVCNANRIAHGTVESADISCELQSELVLVTRFTGEIEADAGV